MTKTVDSTQRIRRRYERIAPIYDFLEAGMERGLFRRQRRRLLETLSGSVLEVGIGTGKNLPFYPPDVGVVGIDFSRRMLDRARRYADRLDRPVELIQMDAQAMAFQDNSFDAVVTTCVFCSVPDPVAGLKEIRRVCRRGGQVVMLEHVRSRKPVVGALMDGLNFIPLHLYGANINRRTLENLERAGLTDVNSEDLWLDILKRIQVTNGKA